MNNSNSYLVDYQESQIRPEDCFGRFATSMKWAYPSQDSLAAQITTVCGKCRDPTVQEKVAQASAEIQRFSRGRVQAIIEMRLREICTERWGFAIS
jgi:hypothetical protein